MGFSVQDSNELANGTVKIIAIENESEKWRNVEENAENPALHPHQRTHRRSSSARRRPKKSASSGANKCYVLTNTTFTRAAQSFAETRPYELDRKGPAAGLLKKTGA